MRFSSIRTKPSEPHGLPEPRHLRSRRAACFWGHTPISPSVASHSRHKAVPPRRLGGLPRGGRGHRPHGSTELAEVCRARNAGACAACLTASPVPALRPSTPRFYRLSAPDQGLLRPVSAELAPELANDEETDGDRRPTARGPRTRRTRGAHAAHTRRKRLRCASACAARRTRAFAASERLRPRRRVPPSGTRPDTRFTGKEPFPRRVRACATGCLQRIRNRG